MNTNPVKTPDMIKYYVRKNPTLYYDFCGDKAFALEGRAAIFACSPFDSIDEAISAAQTAGLITGEYEILAATQP